MRVFISGGAGFIGSNLADRLLEQKNEIMIYDNLETGREDNVNKKIPLVKGDVADFGRLSQSMRIFKPEIVIHAAASYKNPDDYETDIRTNCLGGANIAKLSNELKIKRLIYFQTSCAYGHKPKESPITIDHPLMPDNSSYAITKTTTEYFLQMFKLNYISFRLANCYGPRNLTGPIPTFYKRMKSGQECFVMNTRRDYIYISDLVDLVIRAIKGEGKCGAYHISTGKDYSISEIYEKMIEILCVEKNRIDKQRGDDDTETILIDPSKTHKDFKGWKATATLEYGLRKAVSWYETHEFDKTYTHLRAKT
jgi:UDP-glucose 4-epimerase